MHSPFGFRDPRRRAIVRPALPRERPLPAGTESFAPIELAPSVAQHLQRVAYEGDSPLAGRLHRIPEWERWTMEQKIAFLRSFVEDTARDPAIARKAVQIIRSAGVPLRNHRAEWGALLKWVQQNVRFTAEPNERIQSPQFTLTERWGDCDDLGVALAALGHSLRLPFRFTISGRDRKGNRVRWVEGTGPCPTNVNWSHIYVLAQWPPFKPRHAAWAEPTLDVPLGWDSMRDAIPGADDRADLAAVDSLPAKKSATPVRDLLRAISWPAVVGSVMGSVATAVLLRNIFSWIEETRGEKKRRR